VDGARRLDALVGRLCAVASPPPPSDLEPAAWRTEVGRFRGSQSRRRFPLTVHVGVPLGPRVAAEVPWPMPPGYDDGLRFDLVDALLDAWSGSQSPRPPEGYLWLTRPGVPEPHDVDLLWHAAATRAFAAHDVALVGVLALTRTGWVDVRSGERRGWRRLRL
jgi:hypothetical protein